MAISGIQWNYATGLAKSLGKRFIASLCGVNRDTIVEIKNKIIKCRSFVNDIFQCRNACAC
jgi:hypothetical protein